MNIFENRIKKIQSSLNANQAALVSDDVSEGLVTTPLLEITLVLLDFQVIAEPA